MVRRITLAALALAVGVAGIWWGSVRGPAAGRAAVDGRAATVAVAALRYQRLDRPARTVARTADGTVVATMTDGTRTVALLGPERTFADPGLTDATVTTRSGVRLLPRPWTGGAEREGWFPPWLEGALRDPGPDVLGVAAQYLRGQPEQVDEAGVRYRGDAGFGPDRAGAGRAENSDFYDYLGVPWTFPDGARTANPARFRDVDCSGFVRLVFGYRMGLPLRASNTPGDGLPRRAYAMAAFGPGTAVVADRGVRSTDYSALQVGDLLFFNLDGDAQIDHVGLYLGLDSDGHHRFLSSRGKADGPTLGDLGGTSLLDDGGYYSRAFRAARRL